MPTAQGSDLPRIGTSLNSPGRTSLRAERISSVCRRTYGHAVDSSTAIANRLPVRFWLVAHVLIGSDEDVIALVFSPGYQVSIAQFRPPSLPHGVDRMVAEMAPKWRGRALIEQDPHD